ncbi:MAG: hypothetical protein ACX931_16740 [Saccharospirillum sp.]
MLAEFLVVFLVTLLVVGGVALAMLFGKSPVYQPTQESIEKLLTQVLEGTAGEQEWSFFLEMPIRHDADLEALRLKCAKLHEDCGLRARHEKARLNEAGHIRLRHILAELENSGSRTF